MGDGCVPVYFHFDPRDGSRVMNTRAPLLDTDDIVLPELNYTANDYRSIATQFNHADWLSKRISRSTFNKYRTEGHYFQFGLTTRVRWTFC